MARSYKTPEIPDGHHVADLVPEDAKANELNDQTIVTCLHRGRKPISDTFDGRHFTVPAGYVRMPYGQALHIQRRAIVPGTKNLEVGGFVSWLAIVGVDAPELCVPFTDEELVRFGEAVEAIDRSAMSDPADRDVTLMRTGAARAAMPGQGLVGGPSMSGPRKPVIDGSVQATDAAREAAKHVMEPTGNAAADATREALAEGWAPPSDDGRSESAPPPTSAELTNQRGRGRRG
jgi:hypothetical protein